MLKMSLTHMTPHFLFFFGIIITYIGWSTKKILENIEDAIKQNTIKVDNHEHHISEILSILKVHDFRLDNLKSEVVELKKSGKILEKD